MHCSDTPVCFGPCSFMERFLWFISITNETSNAAPSGRCPTIKRGTGGRTQTLIRTNRHCAAYYFWTSL
ncbi:hypothetical protein F2P79_009003 [Pimephales promelas]|nr:hypothetical protein F2P79_009003 [Pimephales promelas]